ncbi:MAG: ribbon-helix-helix domain-containing protein [Oscillospiraceae bacterium]|nr:ribbon-helix-helix domain-containing protein [Oscillospiraceae bacterium]
MFKIAKGYDSVTKTIRIPEPLAQELETLATQNNISLNQLINQCVVFALEHQEKQDTTENTANSKEK